MKVFGLIISLLFVVYGVHCMVPRGPEQIHISFGHVPEEMYVMWSMSHPCTCNVTYTPLPTTLVLLAVPHCWQFTKGNPSGLQYLCRADLVSGRGYDCVCDEL